MAALTCPLCKGPADRAIYLGFPLKLCQDARCCAAWGIGAYVVKLCPITNEFGDFTFMTYKGTWYLPALWHWLKGGAHA